MIFLWRVTEKCNFSCPFCLYDRRLETPRRVVDPALVTQFIATLGEWARQRSQTPMVSWLGGEPFLWKPLAGLTIAARQAGISISATTNGSTLHLPAHRQLVIDQFSELTISVDGFADFHDTMRGQVGIFDAIGGYLPLLAAARGPGLRLRANVVLMRQNLDDFPDLCRWLAGLGIDEISFNQLGGRDRPEFFDDHRLARGDPSRLAAMLPALRAELGPATRIVGGSVYLTRFAESAAGVPLPIGDCRVAEQFLFIDEDGWIAPCSFAPPAFATHVADLTVESIDALAGRLNRHQHRAPLAECDDCPSTQQFSKFAA